MDYFVAMVLPRLALGLLISLLIGGVAYRRGSLSRSGVLGAVLTGTTIFGFGGFTAGVLLVAFFVSSSLLSHFKQNSLQKQRATEMFDKGGQRDIGQALANGGAAALFAIADFATQNLNLPLLRSQAPHQLFAVATIGALATACADTWATELGVLNHAKPRLITNMRQVEPGTSGGVSRTGLLAALAGTLFIALLAVFISMVFIWIDSPVYSGIPRTVMTTLSGWLLATLFGVTLGGLLGSLFDSVLGATAQAIYFSDQRQKETEKAIEKDGTPNKLIRGWKWLNNDWVNFISSVVGALISAALVTLLIPNP